MIAWTVGQKAVINRTDIVVIEHVTPTGHAIVKNRTFDTDGNERPKRNSYPDKLEPLTPELESEMDLGRRGLAAEMAAYGAIGQVQTWLQRTLSLWNRRVPDAADVDKAERLTAAIKQIIENVP